jgi:hypothetical protein
LLTVVIGFTIGAVIVDAGLVLVLLDWTSRAFGFVSSTFLAGSSSSSSSASSSSSSVELPRHSELWNSVVACVSSADVVLAGVFDETAALLADSGGSTVSVWSHECIVVERRGRSNTSSIKDNKKEQ